MRLSDLEPGFVSSAAGVRLGVHFQCPKCREQQLYIPTNDPDARVNWTATGGVESLTLSPSVDARHPIGSTSEICNWHGWIRNGEAVLA